MSPVLDRFDVKRCAGTDGDTEATFIIGLLPRMRHRTGVRVTAAKSRSLGRPVKPNNDKRVGMLRS
jgi:hypothetical protein